MNAQDKRGNPGIAQLLSSNSDRNGVEAAVTDYLAHYHGTLADRQSAYADVVNGYFDLATDFYEYGWGQSFHFAQIAAGESFAQAIIRHERQLFHRLGAQSNMTVLDVGCGVGGPMRNLARLAGCKVVGINNNAYQVWRAKQLNAEAGIDEQCRVVPGDFMAMPLSDGTMDGAYAIEATVHAPNWGRVFREVWRVLRPGASFALYDWCLTDVFDVGNPHHQEIKRRIVAGNGLIDIGTSRQLLEALGGAGFDLLEHYDAAARGGAPWFEPLAPRSVSLAGFRSSAVGRKVTNWSLKALELLRIAPKGTFNVAVFLDKAAVALVEGGRSGIFTPMYFVHARKPG